MGLISYSKIFRGQRYRLRCIIESTQGDVKQRTSSNVNIDDYTQTGASNNTVVNIEPVKVQATKCARFNFLSEPGETTRNAIISHCQRVYSAPGWENNGCIICAKPDFTGVLPGLSFAKNITCPVSSSRRKLRFLQDTTAATEKKQEIPQEISKVDVPAFLTVCPIPNPICGTDSAGNKSYDDYFTQFTNDLKTNKLFKDNLNIDNVFLNTATPIITVDDSSSPDLSKLEKENLSHDDSGNFSIKITYPNSPLKCNWTTSDKKLTFAQMKACTDAAWCGKSDVGPQKIEIKPKQNKAFTPGSSYNLYLGCENDVPNSQKQSEVVSLGSFSIKKPEENNNQKNSTDPNTTSANFLNFSIFGLLLVFSMIFN